MVNLDFIFIYFDVLLLLLCILTFEGCISVKKLNK